MSHPLSPGKPLQTAVLFIVFNRPKTTEKVFEAIRRARPPKLYVAGDGPRAHHKGEAKLVAKVREIATAVDWPCELLMLFQHDNLGCKFGPQTALNWFFAHEDRGIILEDDCLPNPDFFPFCEWALTEFESSEHIFHVNGNTFGAPAELYGKEGVSFTSLAQVWGWATWAKKWNGSEKNVYALADQVKKASRNWDLPTVAKVLKKHHLSLLQKGLDTWDYQWQLSILNQRGLAVSPSSNLISNIGAGSDATHTKTETDRMNLPTFPIRNLWYANAENNARLTSWYAAKMGLSNRKKALLRMIRTWILLLPCLFENLLVKLFFWNVKPVVIASTGRAGSTMLAKNISVGLMTHRFFWLPEIIRLRLSDSIWSFKSRFSQIRTFSHPVLKTHDLYDEAVCKKSKCIFVVGDPVVSAQSVYRMGQIRGLHWIEEHIYHLGGLGSPVELFEKDVLNYSGQINSWKHAKGVFIVHYEDLWDRISEISAFVGFNVTLPQRQPRKNDLETRPFCKDLVRQLKASELEIQCVS